MKIQGEIIVAGNVVADILARPVERIEYGFTVWIDSIEQHLGGNGSNTSYALATLGIPVRLRGAVGSDPFGDFLLSILRGAGVNLDETEQGTLPTASTVVLVAPDGSRSFIHAPGISEQVFSQPGDFLPGPGHFHLANIFSLPGMRRTGSETLRRAIDAGWTTSLDTGHDTRGEWMSVLEPCLKDVQLLFANEAESRIISGCTDLRGAARVFLDRGVSTVVIKRGRQGCVVFDANTQITAPGFAIEPVDTTGAGDCFTGGFLASLHRGRTLVDAATFANACGALSASKMGSISGLRGYQETIEWIISVPATSQTTLNK